MEQLMFHGKSGAVFWTNIDIPVCCPLFRSFAKRLPVGVAPHQVVIATMRNDMIDNGCRHILSLRQTLHAQRMLPQVRLADTLPLAAVATLGG